MMRPIKSAPAAAWVTGTRKLCIKLLAVSGCVALLICERLPPGFTAASVRGRLGRCDSQGKQPE